MPRSFDILTDSPTSVEQVHAAFGREDYWLARQAAFDAASTLDSLTVDADGTVSVHLTQYLGRRMLPAAVVKLLPGDLKILHRETWKPVGDHRVHGWVSVLTPASLGSGHLDGWLTGADSAGKGSQLRFAARVEVKIPLVGGKLEKLIGADLTDNITAIQRFTTAWIGEHG